MRVNSKLMLLLVILLTFALPIAAHAAVAPPEDCPEGYSRSEQGSDECVKTEGGQNTTSGDQAGAAQAPSEEPSPEPSPSTDPSPSPQEDPVVRAAQEAPNSEAPPGQQGSLQTSSGTCLLEVRFIGFDTGQSHVRVEVFAIPPSGNGLIFEAESEEVLARRQGGNTVSLVKNYDLSGSVGGLEPTAGGFQVRVVAHVTGEDGVTTTKTKNDRLPCVAVGEVAGPRVLGVAFDARRARGLPATGIEASDYLIIASMTFILG
ncbi:MAG TPA: hypothetical protein VND22_05000, partial [Actinomycetota bacterium]|nr:hypothetical protein [Actinomycetota bacterium]